MKILLVAINAKFIHSSLAVRYLSAYNPDISDHIKCLEYTINNSEDYILTDVFSEKPDVICFSCYIWNIEMIISISQNLKKVLPDTKIICGGPEVSYDCEELLKNNPTLDIIIYGEGEKTFGEVSRALINGTSLDSINGIVYRNNETIITSPPQAPLSMDQLPFVYDTLDDLRNKIIYYETQRGCPYNCQFCLSSIEKGVRFLSLEKVYGQLDFFLEHKARQVKFVDRTFNCNKKHAEAIWSYLIENDNGITNFHMEIEAHIMEDDTLELLSKAREGLFQFEIGVQSTNQDTLTAVKRNPDFLSLKERIQRIKDLGNIHIHLDLIAGLPFENYNSFGESFNDVYALFPHQLQLGFLKVLKGSGLKENASQFGLVSRNNAPYEILFTNALNFTDMCRLKTIEEMVETYYNSGKALRSAQYIATFFSTPFAFYEALGDFWTEQGFHRVNHSKEGLYTNLYEFTKQNAHTKDHMKIIKDILKFDMLACDNLNSLPKWLFDFRNSEDEKAVKRKFFNDKEKIGKILPALKDYSPAQLSRMCRLEPFGFNVIENIETKEKTYFLFNYYERDFLANQAKFIIVEV